jgi:hypothetical protein
MGLERRGLLVTALVAVGGAAAVFAWLPAAWPNPWPQGPVSAAHALPRLRGAASAVDAACARGDLAAFAAATTAAHRTGLQRRLAALDRPLDAATLRALGADAALTQWLELPWLAGEVRGERIVIAVARPGGDGAQLLAFVWDGRRLCFDGSRHAPGVHTAAAAAARVATSFDAGR